MTIAEAIREKKGRGITIINLEEMEIKTTDRFIVCQGTSTSHVSSIADSVRDIVLEKTGRKPYHYDGYRNCEWIVIDYGEVMVHVFLPDVRTRYDLEGLWSDAPVVNLPDED